MKSQFEVEFDLTSSTMDTDFQLVETQRTKLTPKKLEQFSKKINHLSKVLQKIESSLRSTLRANKNADEYDVKDKIRRYKERFEKFHDRFKYLDALYLKQQKRELMKNKGEDIEMDDLELLQSNRNKLLGVRNEGYQVYEITQNNYNELVSHDKIIADIETENKQFEHELSITDQLMRVLTSRDLLTKLILVLLIFFLGLSDIIILFLKIV